MFVAEMRSAQGPLSDSFESTQSPAAFMFANAEPSAPKVIEEAYTIRRGDTLGGIFDRMNLGHTLPHAIGLHNEARRLVNLRIGSQLQFGRSEEGELIQLRYPIDSLSELVVSLDQDTVVSAQVYDLPFSTVERVVSGNISSSLYEAALEAGLSVELVMEIVQIFGWDIDFVLDIRAGDSFHVIFQEHQMNGERLTDGNVLAAEFTTQNQTYRAVRFTDAEGETSYYNPQGESMLGTFLRSPVEFSRISSRFGRRKHPILKKWRAHKGVDYAASRGTPIRATADGKIIHAGNKGGYGKTVILRHADRFSTLYGHMNGFAKSIRRGGKVKQGDVIGYIGSTGLATGPHLHYEFRLDGVHRNPLTFKTPKASAVKDADRFAFETLANQQLARLDQISESYQLALSKITTDASAAGE